MSDDKDDGDDGNDKEKMADVIPLQVIVGGKVKHEGMDWNMWFRAELMARLADPNIDFSNAALIARTPNGTQLLCTRDLMAGSAEFAWAHHKCMSILIGPTEPVKK